jgi:hypothetical protein
VSSSAAAAGAQPFELFSYTARHAGDARPVVILRGLQAPGSLGLTIEAEVHPIESGPRGSVLRRPYRFASREQALRFVDEALLALEYLDCDVS